MSVVEREPPGSEAPLSFSEEEMWYNALFEPNVPAYNEYDAFILEGSLDRGAFESALHVVAERHDAFRVTFHARDGEPLARYGDAAQLDFAYDDLGGRDSTLSEQAVSTYAREVIRLPFDLSNGPLARARLARIGPDRYLFFLAMHHLIKDVFSEGILLRELSECYAANLERRTPQLPALTSTPASWARRQRNLAATGAFEAQLAYWAQELDGAVPAEVLGDFARPATLSGVGATSCGGVDGTTLEALRALAHAEDASLFTLLISAYALLLQRYSGCDDVPVAFPVAGRNEQTSNLVGCFINMLIFRARFEDDCSFRDVLRRSRDTLKAAYANGNAPYAHVVNRLAPPRRADQSALAAAVVTLRAAWFPKLILPGVGVRRIHVDLGIARGFDLGMEFDVRDDGIGLELEYRTTLYARETAARIVRNFETLLRSIAANPDASHRSLEALSPEERRRLGEWSAGPARDIAEPSVVAALARPCATGGEAIALFSRTRTLTYAALDAASTASARALLRRGRASTIALVADRSIESIVAMLAILKSGAAYVPLDPAYPQERIRFMVEDSGAAYVLSAAEIAALTETGRTLDDPPVEVGPRDAVYVMYTSGSTGVPNGVVVEHRSLVNYLDAFRAMCAIEPRDRILQFASPAFDISVEEIFGALTSGAALVLLPPAAANSISDVLELCEQAGVTILDLPTAYFHEVAEALAAGTVRIPSSVRLTIVGGEGLDRDRAAAFFAATNGRVRLINTYGPTETTVVVTANEVEHEAIHRVAGSVPIGRPIQNVRVALLDRYRRDVPIGVPGELNVGGVALARGYLNRPEVEARRFRLDPSDGTRWYATGDSARFIARTGALQHLGRLDFQRKVRGFRLDPGEVEAALMRDERVRDAMAVVDDRERLLAAVVLTAPGARESDLRAALAERVPPFAVPSRIALIETIPLTANGKRDRNALLRLLRESPTEKEERVAAGADDVRTRLIALWSELLDRAVTPEDDFFEIGGYSLLAARMFARVEAAFGKRVPLNRFLAQPTVDGLAELLQERRTDPTPLLTIYGAERKGRPFFYLHAGTGAGPFLRLLGEKLDAGRPLYALAPHGTDGEPMPATVEAMAADYLRTVKRVQPAGPYTLGGHCLGAIVAIEMARQLHERGEIVDQVIAIEAVTPNFAFAAPLRVFDRLRRRLRFGEDATRALTARLKAYWRYVTYIADPERRRYGLEPFTRLWNRLTRRPAAPVSAPAADPVAERISDRLLRVCDRYNPPHYDGRLIFVYAHEGPRDVFDVPIWRHAGSNVTILETPGAHITSMTTHVDDVARLLSKLLDDSSGSAR